MVFPKIWAAINELRELVQLALAGNGGSVPNTRRVNAGPGLTGGGALSSDVTITLNDVVYVTATGVVVGGTPTQASPYNAKANDYVVCLTGLGGDGSGNVSVNLPALTTGNWVTVKHDSSTSLAANTITINAPAATRLEEPPPNNGSFTAPGGSLVLGNDPSGASSGLSLTYLAKSINNGALLLE